MKLSNELRDKIARLIPEGYSVDDLCIASADAQIQLVTDLEPDAQVALERAQEEAGPALITDGKPTVMRIVSWIGHANVPNKNRDAFVSEELQSIASALFRAPNLGVMDFNHSAVRPWVDEPKVIGVWYKAEWAFDQKAAGGKGAWGVIATGILFSWLFPDVSDKVLADQARTGSVKVSWAWIPGSIEPANDDFGSYRINHNPVFFTVSLLDLPPADSDATGKSTEDPEVDDDELRRQVAAVERLASLAAVSSGTGNSTKNWWKWIPAVRAASSVEDEMTIEEMKAELEAQRANAAKQVEELAAQYVTKENELRNKIVEFEKQVAELAKAKDELETQLAETVTAKTVALTELEKAAGELEKVMKRNQELEDQIKTLAAKLMEIDAQRAEAAKRAEEASNKVRLSNRIAQLPDTYRKAHQAREESVRSRIEAKWSGMSDEAWAAYLTEELAIVPAKVGFVLRSAAEGVLPFNDDDLPAADNIKARVSRLLK